MDYRGKRFPSKIFKMEIEKVGFDLNLQFNYLL